MPHPSLADLGARIGPLSALHIAHAFRRMLIHPAAAFDAHSLRLLTGQPHPFGNFTMLLPGASAASTRTALAPLLPTTAPAAVLSIGALAPDAESVVTAAGFERHGGMPAMAVDIDALAPAPLPTGYSLHRLTSPDQRDAWCNVFAQGFEIPAPVAAAFAGRFATDPRPDAEMHHYWVLREGAPVATSILFLHEGVAGIYAVSTIPDQRGKGLGAHVTAQPLRIARTLGYRVGVLQATEAGHPVYLRLGFKDFDDVPMWIRMPA